jgi:chromate transporter
MLREETVRQRHWLADEQLLDLFGAVSVLPGPSSTQLAIVLSRRRAGWWGPIVGGVCFIGPATVIVLGLAWAYVRYRATPTGGGILYGIEPVVAVALWGLAGTALRPPLVRNPRRRRAGRLLRRHQRACHPARGRAHRHGGRQSRPSPPGHHRRPRRRRPGRHRPGLISVAAEFAKPGVVVFGSGYVLLAFLRRDLVNNLHWLSLRQVLDAVAAGQVTPGPVFTTATFLGYLIGGFPAALVATAAIFLPSLVMVTVLEPVVGRIRRSPWASPGLSGITVAALGLMAGVTFELGRAAVTDALTAALALATLAVLVRWRPNAFWLVAAGAAVGIPHALFDLSNAQRAPGTARSGVEPVTRQSAPRSAVVAARG